MAAILRWVYVRELWLATITVDRIASSNLFDAFPGSSRQSLRNFHAECSLRFSTKYLRNQGLPW